MVEMWYFLLYVLLQTTLFIELGLLFLRVLGKKRPQMCVLGKSCWTLTCMFIWLSRIVGYLFITFAAYILAMGILQILSLF